MEVFQNGSHLIYVISWVEQPSKPTNYWDFEVQNVNKIDRIVIQNITQMKP